MFPYIAEIGMIYMKIQTEDGCTIGVLTKNNKLVISQHWANIEGIEIEIVRSFSDSKYMKEVDEAT